MSRAGHIGKPLRLVLLAAALWAPVAVAHGPPDHSARVTLFENELELGLTLGPDLARQVLLKGGLSEAGVEELLASRGPSGRGVVSPEGSAALVELSAASGALIPTRASVLTDGLEYLFVITYPRPSGGTLSFRARYLEGEGNAPPGTLEVVVDGAGLLAMEPLKHSRTTLELALPPRATASGNLAVSAAGPSPITLAPAPAINGPDPLEHEAPRRSRSWAWWLGGCALAGLALLSCGRRK